MCKFAKNINYISENYKSIFMIGNTTKQSSIRIWKYLTGSMWRSSTKPYQLYLHTWDSRVKNQTLPRFNHENVHVGHRNERGNIIEHYCYTNIFESITLAINIYNTCTSISMALVYNIVFYSSRLTWQSWKEEFIDGDWVYETVRQPSTYCQLHWLL